MSGLLCLVFALLCLSLAQEQSRHIVVGPVRFSFLTPSVIRVETGGVFEDRPSITFPQRYSQPVPKYKILSHTPLVVQTESVTLRYDPSGNGNVSCRYFNFTLLVTWGKTTTACFDQAKPRVPSDPQFPGLLMDEWTDIILGPPGNLNGSLDTTDCYIGADPCYKVYQSRMQLGLVSREGWSVVDDTNTALWDEDKEWRWRIPRMNAKNTSKDYYIFAHGHSYKSALGDFVQLAGPVPLKPWRSYGVWTSREYPYTDILMKELIINYEVHELPLNMIVLDYGWHYGPYNPKPVANCNQPLVAGGACKSGYGGFVWNKGYFPSPQDFQRWVHDRDLQMCLNIHDQCGIDSCQEHYAMAARMNGIDPTTKDPVPCNFLNKTYALAQSTLMLEDGENENVDFWWNDYGLGGPEVGGYQLKCYKHDSANSTFPHGPPSFGHCMHCYGDANEQKPQLWNAYIRVSRNEKKDKRGMVLGINGGLGHHRYPAVGSGDVFENWNSLQFEIYLTLSAANVATEWNHDLGGFMPGPHSWEEPGKPWRHNPELYLRWLQAGIFQPIFRTHICCSGNPLPWDYPNFPLLQRAYHFRNALVPYLYTASYHSHRSGVLPTHPLYYEWPELNEPYECSLLGGSKNLQHVFGNDFVVSPITAFTDPNSGTISWTMWVPPGHWMDWFEGTVIPGPTWHTRSYTQEEIPLLVRASSVIPMKTYPSQKERVPSPLSLLVPWNTVSGSGWLYEDGGEDLQYLFGSFCILRANFTVTSASQATLSVMPCVEGKGFVGSPETRSYLLTFRGAPASAKVVSCAKCGRYVVYREEDGRVPVLVVATPHLAYGMDFALDLEF